MKKKSISLTDFGYLVDLIRNRVEFTDEQRILWEQSLKQIELEIDKPRETNAIVPKRYTKKKDTDTFKEKPMRRFKNWLIQWLKED